LSLGHAICDGRAWDRGADRGRRKNFGPSQKTQKEKRFALGPIGTATITLKQKESTEETWERRDAVKWEMGKRNRCLGHGDFVGRGGRKTGGIYAPSKLKVRVRLERVSRWGR